MKTVILCGGLGTRLSEVTKVKPKPMIKIGNKPILNHIIDILIYQAHLYPLLECICFLDRQFLLICLLI